MNRNKKANFRLYAIYRDLFVIAVIFIFNCSACSQTNSESDVGRTMISEKDGMTLIYIPEGEFMMGSDDGQSDTRPAHIVYLDSYWIDKTEVTNIMFSVFLNQQGNQTDGTAEWFDADDSVRIHLNQNNWEVDSGYENHPVIAVSWFGADAYCSWVDRRLPTESEWEKAARGVDERIYPWGNQPPNSTLANYDKKVGSPSEVGAYPDGASPYGVLDMAGNAYEWVNDWYEGAYYENLVKSNPPGPSNGHSRTLRGGSWAAPIYTTRAAERLGGNPGLALDDFGFRCAMDAE